MKIIYGVEAYDVLQVTRHASGCDSLGDKQLQNPDMFYAGQGLYP